MPVRLRKLIGMIIILAFCAAYVVVAVMVGEHLPDHWAARLIYFAVVGTAWGVPLFPVIKWMNRES